MPSFSSELTIPKVGLVVLVFTRIHTEKGTRYYVVVEYQVKKVNRFIMKQVADTWLITDIALLPEWLLKLENKIGQVIKAKG